MLDNQTTFIQLDLVQFLLTNNLFSMTLPISYYRCYLIALLTITLSQIYMSTNKAKRAKEADCYYIKQLFFLEENHRLNHPNSPVCVINT